MSFPNYALWWHVAATVAVEVCGVAALGFAAQRAFRRAVWQRTIWQVTVVCLLLLPVSEWTGIGRGTAGLLFGKKREAQGAPAAASMAAHREITGGLAKPAIYPLRAAPRLPVWWPGWVWLSGAAVVLGRMAAAQILLLALRLRREKIATESLRERVLSVARSVGLRRRICLLRMPESISPMAFGILRPSIGLPPGFEARFSAAEQEAILAHELAHLAARDPMWFLLADLASALLWWHPLAWWARRSLHVSSELAADEATALVPDGPCSLAKCLVALGKEMTGGRGWGWIGINGGFRSKLGKRVERLMRMSGGARRPLAGWAGAAARSALGICVVPGVVLLFGAFQSVQGQKQESWRETVRESWNNSPGAVLLLAAQENTGKDKEDIAIRVQDAKVLFELGKLDESEAVFVQVLKDDLSNRTAPYYLDLIKETRFKNRTHKADPMAATNLIYMTKGRLEILSKLDRIHLSKVQCDLPLPDVLLRLRIESQERDPDRVGINFLINPHADAAPGTFFPANTGNAPGGTSVVAPAPLLDMTTVTIKISPPLENLRLKDVLNAIVMTADHPIKYAVEDYGVVFSPKSTAEEMLSSRLFRLDPTIFVQNLKAANGKSMNASTSARTTGSQMEDDSRRTDDALGGPTRGQSGVSDETRTNESVALDRLFRDYFAAAGVDLTDPGKSVFFDSHTGRLLVRATARDLEIIEHAIGPLNQWPPQVTITSRFVEMSQYESAALGFNWFLQESSTASNPTATTPSKLRSLRDVQIPGMATVTGIMSDAQSRVAMNIIEHNTADKILAAPKVTTLSGREASVSSSDGDGGVTTDLMAEVGADGFSIHTMAEVGADGFSIHTTAIARIKTAGENWQVSASQELRDGQTLVIGGVMTNLPPDARKLRLVFITPRIIDPAGNLVHTDGELSGKQ